MNELGFQQACERVLHQKYQRNSIGLLNEKTLHAVLKYYFEPCVENHEKKVGDYVADIVGESGIIEIQTRSYAKLRNKLAAFLEVCPVTVVYPLAAVKWLRWIDSKTGECSPRRKSPKQETIFDAFWELSQIRAYLLHPNLTLCIVLLELEEYRSADGKEKRKKWSVSRLDRIPLSLLEERYFRTRSDYLQVLSPELPEHFTVKEFAAIHKIRLRNAQSTLYTLRNMGAIHIVGRQGRAHLYSIKE